MPEAFPASAPINSEPTIRIGLATAARSVTISTTGRLLHIEGVGAESGRIELARVRIEPRFLPPPTAPAVETPVEDESIAWADTTIRPTRGAGPPKGEIKTEKSSARISPAPPNAKSGVRLSSRTNAATRGAVLYEQGQTMPLADVRAPVVFASADETQDPVRFNEKPYRGRLEVFANTRGTLTVVNELSLEEYVRGVVPNELSPGGFPALEALKAQAVAARTYALSNLGRYQADGFDLLPTTRSQVYGGRSTEHPLTDRAVAETRGRVATFDGKPINALYTSTCGGHTENGENIFGGDPVPYLRAHECALEDGDGFDSASVRTARELPDIKSAEHASSARDAALLAAHAFNLPSRLGDDWLADAITVEEVRALLSKVAQLTRQNTAASAISSATGEATRAPGFCTAFALALDGESRGGVLLNRADVEYFLSFRDAESVPEKNRADVAAFMRDGHLMLFPDATLRPRLPLTRARALKLVARTLESRGLFRLQKGTTRAASTAGGDGTLNVRAASGKGTERGLKVAANAFLFRSFGETLFPVREIKIVGGEALTFHTDADGEVDYLEVRPAQNGAASDHTSSFAFWTETLTPGEILSRLSRSVSGVGALLDLRVRKRGLSGRVLDLEVIGTNGTAHVLGGRIRSALGLREQLFVIERSYDETGRVTKFILTGRGWGHGVGMCQIGAYGLARAGLTYDKILKSYYAGISLTKLY
ncbi:MAG: SpoIID/LytB domain-containing protein [Acidobacteria bacterium]|nr:SpoIID/LytB domain-containing protein [Acidobacteriota bacterium]